MIEAVSCGGVVIYRGKILTLYKSYKNKYSCWVLPKGTVEDGEEFKETAVREVYEEAGVHASIIKYVGKSRYTQITGSVGLAGYMTEVISDGTSAYNAEVTQMIKDAGVMWNGVPAVKAGAIIIGILLGTMTVFIIEKQLHKRAVCGTKS